MNRIRLIAIGTLLMSARFTVAQQATARPGAPANAGVPTVDEQQKVLTERLDLTNDQQAKVKTILQELQQAAAKTAQDENLSRDERLGSARVRREKADKEIRKILSDDQKKRLDQIEQESHPELHGNLIGSESTVEKQQKVLTEKLDLTIDQQVKINTILRELHDATESLTEKGMSHDERLGKVRACRKKADNKIREILSGDQKKTLDQLEQESHPELHDNLNAAIPSPRSKN
jgi:Spy/CpxP family protein refolding chaperone